MAKFVITQSRVVKNWPCRIPVPQDNGQVNLVKVGLDIELPPKDDYVEATKKAIADADGDPSEAEKNINEFIKSCIKGWKNVALEDDSKEDAEFNASNLDDFANITFVRPAIQKAFNAAMEGAREKN